MATSFNEQELLENVGSDLEFLAETVQMLASDGPSLMLEINHALAEGDAPALGRAAHTLKGMVANFCAAQTQATAFELEKAGKGGDLSTAPSVANALADQLGQLIADLQAFLQEKR
jgi:two-component system, sensor histidine kinase and response regulator